MAGNATSGGLRRCQVGIESTPGTPVGATRRLRSVSILPKPVSGVETFRGEGDRFPTGSSTGKETTTARIEGVLAYNEIGYLLGACLGTPTGGSYSPTLDSPHALDTLTVEVGNADAGDQFAYGVVNSLELTIDKKRIGVSGSMVGQPITNGFTLTALSYAAAQVASGANASVYLGASVGGLAKVTGLGQQTISFGERFDVVPGVNSSEPGFSWLVEKKDVVYSAKLIVPHDSDAEGYLTELRGMTEKWCRVLLEDTFGVTSHSLQITFPFLFTDVDRGETEGVDSSTWGMQMVYDEALLSAVEVVLT